MPKECQVGTTALLDAIGRPFINAGVQSTLRRLPRPKYGCNYHRWGELDREHCKQSVITTKTSFGELSLERYGWVLTAGHQIAS